MVEKLKTPPVLQGKNSMKTIILIELLNLKAVTL
jgi:hypothetical protein